MRRLPAWRSSTSLACLSTFRCCETAGRLTGISPARAPTDEAPAARRSKIARRVGSPRAAIGSAETALAIAYRKLSLTDGLCQYAPPPMSSGTYRDPRDMTQDQITEHSRWIALYVLCAGVLMIVLDVTIVNVALPSIQDDLGFSSSSLAWVVNAYLIAFGGLLLLAGRLGDLIGRRTVFLAGLAVFSTASLA